MRFPSTFFDDILQHTKRFTLQNVLSVPISRTGVYLLAFQRMFIYIGQGVCPSGVRERLLTHYNGSHSTTLNLWTKALDGELRFGYISCKGCDVDDLERSLIVHFQPIANGLLYAGYEPTQRKWRKPHG